MIAGSDTTSNLIIATVFHVFEKTEVSERLRKEINAVIKGDANFNMYRM